MVIFTTTDYWRYRTTFPVKQIWKDIQQEYKLEKEKKRKETHQYHDKIFKEILDNKKEFIKKLNEALNSLSPDSYIRILQYHTSII